MDVLKEELNCSSTYVPAQLTKDRLLLRHIDTLTKSVRTPGFKSRKRPPYPQRVVKGD